MTFETKRLALGTGVTLAYVEQGDPAGMPVILLHGITDSHRAFEPLLAALPAGVHAVALTQRGHGDAGHPLSNYRPEDFAADLAAFMDAKGLARAVIVGHSMGSVVARAFAAAFPTRAIGLVLIGAFATLHDKGELRAWIETEIMALEDPVDVRFARDFQVSTLANPVPEAFLDTVINESLKVPANVWKQAFAGLVEGDRTRTGAGAHVPTLILWGDKDGYCSRLEQDLLCRTFGAQLVTYEGAGHAPHWEFPDRVAGDIAAWLTRIAHAEAA